MKSILTMIFLGLLIVGCKSNKVAKKITDDDYFKVDIIQNGKILKKKDGIYRLKKQPFLYQVTL